MDWTTWRNSDSMAASVGVSLIEEVSDMVELVKLRELILESGLQGPSTPVNGGVQIDRRWVDASDVRQGWCSCEEG